MLTLLFFKSWNWMAQTFSAGPLFSNVTNANPNKGKQPIKTCVIMCTLTSTWYVFRQQ